MGFMMQYVFSYNMWRGEKIIERGNVIIFFCFKMGQTFIALVTPNGVLQARKA